MADLSAIKGDIECHINSPGGDIFDGIAIYNQLKARQGNVKMVIDGLAASAASFIAQAASPGQLEVAPHATMMIHEGFAMCIGNAADLIETAALLDKASDNIAGIYADRTGKPASYWREQMQAETWYTDAECVEIGLADKISGQDSPKDAWDLSVYAKAPGSGPPATMTIINADGTHAAMTGTHEHAHPAYGAQGGDASHSHEHSHDGGAEHAHEHAPANQAPKDTRNAAGNNGWQQRDGKWVFDPDGDGDNDATAAGDTDHDYWSADGKQIKAIPPDPDGKQGKPLPPGNAASFPVLDADFDTSAWDASKAWSAGAKSDDPAAFYRGICAGRKAGDPKTQDAWALPYKYSPSSAPNAAGVKAALARLPSTNGLTNADEAKSKLQKLMKQINPDYEPDGRIDPAALRSAFRLDDPQVDDSVWDPAVAWAAGARSSDPAWFYSQICAGRRAGDPGTQEAWALPYRYGPELAPNAAGVRDALARLPRTRSLTNKSQARDVLEAAMKKIDPSGSPDDHIDAGLLSAAFASGLEGADR